MVSVLHEKREEIWRIARQHGARRLRLFGSAAHGRATEKSDIDLLVEMESGRTLLDIIAIQQDIEELLGRRVDLVTERGLSPYIRAQILKEAVNL